MFEAMVWWFLAVIMVVASLLVLHVRDIFKAALFLVVAFLTVVGFFVMLRAEFLAVVQLLIYAGAISVLIIFAVMLTRDVHRGNPSNRLRIPAAILATMFLAAIGLAVLKTEWAILPSLLKSTPIRAIFEDTTGELGAMLMGSYVFSVEVAAVLLAATIIGAIVLVRER